MAFSDAAYHLFEIISRNEYAIQNSRFVAYFTQSFPLWSSRFQLPLSTVAILYSLSFPLLYLITFWLLCVVMKNYKVALTYLLLSFLMTRASFYWCLSEVIQGFAFFALYIAFLMRIVEHKKSGYLSRALMLSCMLATVCSHPIIVFSVCFTFVFFFLHYSQERRFLIREAVLFLGLFVVKALVFRNVNDSAASGSLKKGLKLFPHYLDMESNRNFVSYLIHDYHWVGILFVSCLLFYFRRDRLKALLVFSFAVGFVFMNNLAVPFGADQFYVENRYMGLCLFVVLPFVWDVLPQIKITGLKRSLLPIAIITCLVGIYQHHTVYTERLNILRGHVQEMTTAQSDKWILPVEKLSKEPLFLFWGVSYETWVLSTCELNQTYSLVVREQPGEFGELEHCNSCFGTKWAVHQYEGLPKRYFVFKHWDFPYSVH